MVFTKHKMFAPAVLITCLLVFSASPILAQDTTNPAGSRTVTSGQKMKLKGVVTRRDADTFTVRDMKDVAMAPVSWTQQRSGSTKQTCALPAPSSRALRHSKRERLTRKTN